MFYWLLLLIYMAFESITFFSTLQKKAKEVSEHYKLGPIEFVKLYYNGKYNTVEVPKKLHTCTFVLLYNDDKMGHSTSLIDRGNFVEFYDPMTLSPSNRFPYTEQLHKLLESLVNKPVDNVGRRYQIKGIQYDKSKAFDLCNVYNLLYMIHSNKEDLKEIHEKMSKFYDSNVKEKYDQIEKFIVNIRNLVSL